MQFGRSYEEFEVGATYKHWPGKTVTEYDEWGNPEADPEVYEAHDGKTGQLLGFGDIITGVQGVRTRNANEVVRELQRFGVGETVTVRYIRDGQEKEAQLRLVAKRSMSDL